MTVSRGLLVALPVEVVEAHSAPLGGDVSDLDDLVGLSAVPGDLREAAGIFGVRGWQWWRKVILPAIFPYYVTGAITASGGSWNASIVAEVVSWGDKRLEARGLGSYISDATAAGDYARVALGIAMMSLFVILLNRTFWRPLYSYAERRLRLD